MNAKLKLNISRWLRQNSDKVSQNRSSFPRRQLTVDSSQSLYDSYKTALQNITKSQKKEESNQLKQRLYNEAKKWGYQVSLSSSSIPKLKDYINLYNRALELDFNRPNNRLISFNQLSKHINEKGDNGIIFDDIYGDYKIQPPPQRQQYILNVVFFDSFEPLVQLNRRNRPRRVISFKGKDYSPLTDITQIDDVKTRNDITRYRGTFIQRLNNRNEYTSEYISFMNFVYPDIDISDNLIQINKINGSDTQKVKLLHIQSVEKVNNNLRRSAEPLEERKHYEEVLYNKVYSRYTSYKYESFLLSTPEDNSVVVPTLSAVENPLPIDRNEKVVEPTPAIPTGNCCVITNILQTFKPSWDSYQDKQNKYNKTNKPRKYLTVDFLIEFFNSVGVKITRDDMGLSVREFRPFFEKYRLPFSIHDKYGEPIPDLQYVPPMRNKNIHGTMRCMSYDNHLFLYNNLLKALEKIVPDSKEGRDVDDFLSKPSEFFHCGGTKKDTEYHHIGDFKNIKTFVFNPDVKHYKLYVNDDIMSVLTYLVEVEKYIPLVKRANRDFITSIVMKIEDTTITIENCKTEAGQLLMFNNGTEFKAYHEYSNELKSSIMNVSSISQYADDYINIAKKYTPKALVGLTPQNNPYCGKLYMLDVSKFYTSILMRLPFLPMKSIFDSFVILENPFVIENINEYIFIRNDTVDIPIHIKNTILNNPAILLNGYSYTKLLELVPDFNKYIHYKVGYVFVSHSEGYAKNDTGDIIKRLYECEDLNEPQRKAVVNFLTGNLEKTVNKKQQIEMFMNLDDAIDFKDRLPKSDGVYIHQTDYSFNRFKTKLNILSCKSSTPLKNGFYPIKSFIYQLANIEMLRLSMMLAEKYNAIICGYQTDAIYFRTVQPVSPINKVKGYAGIGTYSIEPRESILFTNSVVKEPNAKFTEDLKSIGLDTRGMSKVKTFTLKHESEWKSNPQLLRDEIIETFNRIFTTDRTLLILADTAGAGKTFICNLYTKYLQSVGKRVESSSFANKRVQELSMHNSESKTIHNLFNIRICADGNDELVEKDGSVKKLRDVDYIYIDEIYLIDIKLLGKLGLAMVKYPHLKLFATGDINQQNVDTRLKTRDNDAYKDRAMSSIFKNKLVLNINKRFTDPVDIQNLQIIKDRLINQNDKRVILDYVKKVEDITDIYKIVFGGRRCVCITYFQKTREYINDILHKYHISTIMGSSKTHNDKVKHVNDYSLVEGETVLVVKSKKKMKGHSFETNTEYLVVECGETSVLVKNTLTGEVAHLPNTFFTIDKSFFTFNYCYTSIQSQGDTYENSSIILFDVFHAFCDKKSVYTAITRPNTLRNVYVYCGTEFSFTKISEHNIHKFLEGRISSHKEADKRANRPFRDEEFVDAQWVLDKFHGCNPKCGCGKSLTLDISNKHHLFSIDRIHNSLPHIKSNCILSCVHCNKSRKDNQLLQ